MAAHRYWRVIGLEAYGTGDLELSCFHLLASGARVDALATLTTNIAPSTGVVGTLQDDDLATFSRWPAAAVQSIALQWDFGAGGAEVGDIRLAGDSEWRFPLICKLQWSDDETAWNDYLVFSGITYPGVGQKTRTSSSGAGVETFATDPLGRYQILRGNWGWSASEQALEGNNSDVSFVKLTQLGPMVVGDSLTANIQMDSDPLSRRHMGLFLVNDVGISGYRLVGIDGELRMSKWVNNAEGPNFASSSGSAGGVIQVGALVKFRVDYLAGGVFQLYLNDVLRLTGTSDSTGPLVPGFFSYVGRLLIRDVAITSGSAPTIGVNGVKGRVSASPSLFLGCGPAIVYGIPTLNTPHTLGIASGAVKDVQTGVLGQGIGRVRGVVEDKGAPGYPNVPVFRKVRLIRQKDGLLMRELWSDPVTGAYDFTYIDELQTWMVESFDHSSRKQRAVIADNLSLANGNVEIIE